MVEIRSTVGKRAKIMPDIIVETSTQPSFPDLAGIQRYSLIHTD